jgi:hypothetical protein
MNSYSDGGREETMKCSAENGKLISVISCASSLMMEFGVCSINGENKHYGTPVNPAAPDRIPGGSSSGSGVAVAAELVDFSLGIICVPCCLVIVQEIDIFVPEPVIFVVNEVLNCSEEKQTSLLLNCFVPSAVSRIRHCWERASASSILWHSWISSFTWSHSCCWGHSHGTEF